MRLPLCISDYILETYWTCHLEFVYSFTYCASLCEPRPNQTNKPPTFLQLFSHCVLVSLACHMGDDFTPVAHAAIDKYLSAFSAVLAEKYRWDPNHEVFRKHMNNLQYHAMWYEYCCYFNVMFCTSKYVHYHISCFYVWCIFMYEIYFTDFVLLTILTIN